MPAASCLRLCNGAFRDIHPWARDLVKSGVGFEELVTESGLVFEGRVVGESSRVTDDGQDVVTDVEFQVTNVLKGAGPGPRVTLTFSGGTVGDLALVVHGSERPQVGETGVYFVEDPSRRQVHPLFGWSQGHFRTREDAGTGEVQMLTRDGRAISAIRVVASPNTPTGGDSMAAGLELASDAGQPMTLEAFRQRVADLLERTNDY